MSEAVYQSPYQPVGLAYEFLPERERPEDEQEKNFPEYTAANVRKALGGARRMIAVAALRHLTWAFTRTAGGLLDEHGEWWVYKRAKDFYAECQKSCMGASEAFMSSKRTFEYAMTGLARLGVVVRCWVKIGMGDRGYACYAYKPGPNWAAATEGLNVAQGSASPAQPGATDCADAEPYSRKQNGKGRRKRTEPEPICNPGAVPAQIADWARECCPNRPDAEVFTRLEENSRPTDGPVEPEASSVTEEDPASPALSVLNKAGMRMWRFNYDRDRFEHPHQPSLSIAEFAQRFGCGVGEQEIADALDALLPF